MRVLLLMSSLSVVSLLCSCAGNSSSSSLMQSQPPGIPAACGPTQNPGCHQITVTESDGTAVTRTFVLYVPPNFQPNTGALVLVLHGAGDSGAEMEIFSQMDITAAQNGFA